MATSAEDRLEVVPTGQQDGDEEKRTISPQPPGDVDDNNAASLLRCLPSCFRSCGLKEQLRIHVACKKGQNLIKIKALIKACPDGVQYKDKDGKIPLHYYALGKKGQSWEVIQALLDAYQEGAKCRDKDGYLPLHYACKKGQSSEVIAALLERYPEGAKCCDNAGCLPLHYACKMKPQNDEVVDALIKLYPEGIVAQNEQGKMPVDDVIEADFKKFFNKLSVALLEKCPNAEAHNGSWPLHDACKMKGQDLSKVKDLIEKYPTAIRSPDENGFWPLHYACKNGQGGDVIKFLIEKFPDALKFPDADGFWPLHYACKEWDGQSLTVVRAVLTEFPAGARIKHKSNDSIGSLPQHRACVGSDGNTLLHRVCKEGEFIMMEALINAYPNDLCKRNKNGYSPFELDSQHDRGSKFVAFIDYLKNDDSNEKGRSRRDYERILVNCKDFMPLNVLRHGFLHMDTLEWELFIKWLNGQLCNRYVVFMMVFELYLLVFWMYTFGTASRLHYKEDTLESGTGLSEELERTVDWRPIALMIISSIFLWIELGQMYRHFTTNAFLRYFLSLWNWLDIVTNVMVIVSAVRFLDGDPDIDGRLLMATGCLQSLVFLSYMKKTFFPFSKFVSGVIKIIWALVPFLVVSTVALFSFSFMYFVKGEGLEGETIDCPSKKENSFEDMTPSFQTVFSTVAGGAEETKIPLDYIFGIIVIIILFNVVIAVVSDEWAKAVDEADKSFWSYRLDLLIDHTRGGIFAVYIGFANKAQSLGCRMPSVSQKLIDEQYQHKKDYHFGFGHLDDFFINEDTAGTTIEEIKTKLAEKSKREGVRKCIWILIQCFVFILLGFFSFGMMWPRFFRELLFTPAEPKESSDAEVTKLSEEVNALKKDNSELLKEVRELLKLKKMFEGQEVRAVVE